MAIPQKKQCYTSAQLSRETMALLSVAVRIQSLHFINLITNKTDFKYVVAQLFKAL